MCVGLSACIGEDLAGPIDGKLEDFYENLSRNGKFKGSLWN